jgi:hypothetical protein
MLDHHPTNLARRIKMTLQMKNRPARGGFSGSAAHSDHHIGVCAVQEWRYENQLRLLVAVRPHSVGMDLGLGNRTRCSLLRPKENV